MRTKDEKNEQRQRQMILEAAWKLFREKGYENVTMQDILEEAECSKGRFYYYFHAKAELLDRLYELFDQKYEEIFRGLSTGMSAVEKVLRVHHSMLNYMEKSIGPDLLTNLYISQFQHTTNIDFWSDSRAYSGILKEIFEEGKRNGEIRTDLSTDEMVDFVLELERSELIDWCLKKGENKLSEQAVRHMRVHLAVFLAKHQGEML